MAWLRVDATDLSGGTHGRAERHQRGQDRVQHRGAFLAKPAHAAKALAVNQFLVCITECQRYQAIVPEEA
jgi:hypothetical protein